MLFYDVFQDSPVKIGFKNAIEGINEMLNYKQLKEEILNYLDVRINLCECIEKDAKLGFQFPLQLHGRFTRSQILVALQLSTEKNKDENLK